MHPIDAAVLKEVTLAVVVGAFALGASLVGLAVVLLREASSACRPWYEDQRD